MQHPSSRTVILSGLFLCTAAMCGFGADELAVNGGFETAKNQKPAGWTTWSRKQGALTVKMDSEHAHAGERSLHVVHTGERDWAITQEQRIQVEARDIFRITGQVRCKEVKSRATLSVVLRGDGNQTINWIYGAARTRGTHDWRKLTSRFVVPEGTTSIEFRITGGGPGEAWIDDVSLKKVGNVDDLRRELGASGKPLELSNDALAVRVDPKQGTLSLTDRRISHTYRSGQSRDTIILSAARKSERRGLLRLLQATSGRRYRVLLEVDRSEAACSLTLSTDEEQMQEDLAFPPALHSVHGDWLVVPLNEGILYPVDDPSVSPPHRLVAYSGHGLCMPWFGVTDMDRGVMAVIGSPDDMYVDFGRDDNGNLYINPVWQPSKGSLRYDRTITYRLFDGGGYVAQAKAYREVAKREGRFRSLKEKRRANPDVDLLLGAPDVWTVQVDPVEIARKLHQDGVERLLFSFHGSSSRRGDRAEQVSKIKDLGYLVTRYDTYRTSWPEGEPEYAWRHHKSPEHIVEREDGSLRRGWAIKRDGNVYPGYELTSSEQLRRAGEQIPEDQSKHNYDGRFIDTTTAAALMEDYDPDHPLTRTRDRHYKTKLLALISKELGLICGSETGQDWAAPVVHYFEGMMSLGPYRVPDAGRNMYKYHAPTDKLLKYMVGPRYRVPLWELVYHDSVVAYWYWGDASNKQPELWDTRDLWNVLYCTPPLWMIDREDWRKYSDRFVKSYKDVCPVVRKAAYQAMVDHEFLTDDHSVQRTSFSSGLQVTVNFGEEPYATNSGHTVAPMDYLVRKE